MQLREVLDKTEIEAYVSSDPVRALYHLGDLDDYYFRRCSWYFACTEGRRIALILLYKTWGVSLLPLGEPIGLRLFLEQNFHLLPAEIYSLWMTEHDSEMGRFFVIPLKKRMYRMSVTRESFKPQAEDHRVVALNDNHADVIRELLRSYPDNFFEEYQLRTGYYRGIFDGGRLVSMAGIHTVNRENRTAAIGNIVTDEQYRGRGMASAVTSKLVSDLFRDHDFVGLNVNQKNDIAIHIYRDLGFEVGVEFFEGQCRKRTSVTR